MGTLNITEIKKEQAEIMNNCDISLKVDGTLIFYKNGKLLSPRCDRSERFKHILKILQDYDFPNCMGEMYMDIPNACVFDVSKKENWNKCKFMPFDLIGFEGTYNHRKYLLDREVKNLNNPFITSVKRFETFKEGYNYVVENNSEGLIFRDDLNWLKWKMLKEDKIEIVFHEVGKDKGTFILKNGSRLSGTSVQYVEQYVDIKKRGNKPIAEIEYPFLTKDGKYFQPRLRQIVEVN